MNFISLIWIGAALIGCEPTKIEDTQPNRDTANPRAPNPDTNQPPVDDSSTPVDTALPAPDTGEAPADPPDDTWRSALFPDDWVPSFQIEMDDGGPPAGLQDYSYAGYRAGESPIPSADTIDRSVLISVVDQGADPSGAIDSTAAFQATIDAVGEAGGGVVFVPSGEYRIDGLLTVTRSGTVIVGESTETARLSFSRSTDMTGVNHLQFRGSRITGEPIALAEDAPVGAVELVVETADGLSVGDPVGIGMVITPEWVTDHQMDGFWGFSLGARRTIFQRTVVAIDRTPSRPTVTVDVPIRYPMLVRDTADIRTETGAITECGITEISLSSAVGWDAAWSNDRSHVLGFKNARDCWASHLASWPGLAGDETHHLQSGGILVDDSRRMTITATTMEHAQNRGGGGNGYLFEIKRSDEILIHDAVGRAGRHNFIQNWDFGSTGNVFLETLSELGESWTNSSGWIRPTGLSEYHHALAMANLVDSSTAHDGWAAKNRMNWSSGAGHTSTECVFWNMRGDGDLVSLQYGRGYVIGTKDLSLRTEVIDFYDSAGTAPEDWVEGIDEADTLWPPSLYREQLRRRGFGDGP